MRALRADKLDDCFVHDRDRLSHDQAIAEIIAGTRPIAAIKAVSLAKATGRFIASSAHAGRPVPGHDNAAVDGYAIRHRDLGPDERTTFTLTDRIAAGDNDVRTLPPSGAVRIFTGAVVPPGADTIVMQEDAVVESGGKISLPSSIRKGANLRHAGEDLKPGERVVGAAARLRAQDIAALASLGLTEVETFAPLRIGLLSSGNEVRRPGTRLDAGQVYDANSYLLSALCSGLPVIANDLGIAPDERGQVERHLHEAARSCDLVITSGGASRGEEDHLVRALAETGSLNMWSIAVKPGRPLGLGTFDGTRVLMLPGNPVAVMVCFLMYAIPLITLLGGGSWHAPRRYRIPAAFEMKSRKPDRREFLRGILTELDGAMAVDKFPHDGSGLISSLRAADGLIELDEVTSSIRLGDPVSFIPFTEFGVHAG